MIKSWWPRPSFHPLRTIKSRLRSVFVISLGVVLAVGITAALVVGIVQHTVDNLLAYKLPRLQQTMALNDSVEHIAAATFDLSHDTTRSALYQTYNSVEEHLLLLEKTANTLSQNGVNADVIQIQFLSQKVRSEAQLSFQLRAGALVLEADRHELQVKILDDIRTLQGLALKALTLQSSDTHPLTAWQYLTVLQKIQTLENSLTALDRVTHANQVKAYPPEFSGAVSSLEQIMHQQMESSTTAEIALLQKIVTVDWSGIVDSRARQLHLLATSSDVLSALEGTVVALTAIATDYSQRIEAEFTENRAFVAHIERTATMLIGAMSIMAVLIIATVQRQIIGRGFSRRLEIISQGLARVPRSPKETQVPVSGEDEIGLMARRLEMLLRKALAIQTLATIDELTQVANRRSFFQQVHREIQRLQRTQQNASLLMLDVDFFKQINDSYGHHIGDQVLKAVAAICQKSLRTSDILARLGGEEFAIFCPDTSLEMGQLLAERIRSTIEQLQMGPFEGIMVSITISIGVTDLTPLHRNLETALTIADQALYKAKKEGRNQVVVRSLINEWQAPA